MSDLDQLKGIIQQSHKLSRQGHPAKGLALLDDSLSRAVQENRVAWIRTLCRHAAVISDAMGNQQQATNYYKKSLASNPNDPVALYGLAQALRRQGETVAAKECASKCYRVVLHTEAPVRQLLMEMILEDWPELAELL
jgi:Tfp pilus assembly protein PilF